MVGINTHRKRELIRIKLSEIMRRKLDDPMLTQVTLSKVEIDPQTYTARVFYSVFQADPYVISQKLSAVASFLQKHLGQAIHMRQTPQLKFIFDKGFDHSDTVEQILKDIREERDKELSINSHTDSEQSS